MKYILIPAFSVFIFIFGAVILCADYNDAQPNLVRINGVLRPQPDFTLYNPDADVIDSQPVSDGPMVTQK